MTELVRMAVALSKDDIRVNVIDDKLLVHENDATIDRVNEVTGLDYCRTDGRMMVFSEDPYVIDVTTDRIQIPQSEAGDHHAALQQAKNRLGFDDLEV